jgi:hypothetical protein
MRILPVNFTWSADGVMVPDPRFAKVCDKQFVVGQIYPLVPLEARSRASHSHFFATLDEIWHNLPEDQAKRFPTVEYMRKWALVEGHYATEKTFVCDSKAHAMRMAAFVRSIDTYGVIRISGNVVKVFEAKSQSAAAMGKDEFRDSKEKVLEICSALTGTRAGEFKREAAQRVPPERRREARDD